MVKEIKYNTENLFSVSQTPRIQRVHDNQKHFYCEVCRLIYKERAWAEKCEDWCRKYKSCNLEITRHSIKKTLSDLK